MLNTKYRTIIPTVLHTNGLDLNVIHKLAILQNMKIINAFLFFSPNNHSAIIVPRNTRVFII